MSVPPSNPGTELRRYLINSAFRIPRSALTYNVDLNSNRFGVPLTFPVITPAVELVMIQFATVADDASPKVAL